MMGDAAGMISPLCGNGMSMAMHAGKIANNFIHQFLNGEINRKEMEDHYAAAWRKTFAGRLKMGRIIQRFFGKTWLTNLFVRMMKLFPSLTQWLIRQTHGKSF